MHLFLGMKKEHSALSLFTSDETGGIIDDFIVTKVSDQILFIVSNASRKSNVKSLLSEKLVSILKCKRHRGKSLLEQL